MLTKTLAATAALSMLVCGGSALAQSKSSAAAGPKQPIPYARLDAYVKASPKARATKDWLAGSAGAATGVSTDTSATAPSGSSMGVTGASTSTDTSVNPMPSIPSTPPTDSGPMPPATSGDMTNPPPPTNPK